MIYFIVTLVVLFLWVIIIQKKDIKKINKDNIELRRQNKEMLLINYKLSKK